MPFLGKEKKKRKKRIEKRKITTEPLHILWYFLLILSLHSITRFLIERYQTAAVGNEMKKKNDIQLIPSHIVVSG